MNNEFRGKHWPEKTTFADERWEDVNFESTNFENTIFEKVIFQNCLFIKSIFENVRLFSCDFINCRFENVDLRNMPIGAGGGLFKACDFKKCNFLGQHFHTPHFEDCVFDNCKLRRMSCNDASFLNCTFIGRLDDVNFNGIYHTTPSHYKPLENIDFSAAIFGEFVSFDNCDLSTSIPPKNHSFAELLYQIYDNDPSVLSTGSTDRIILTRAIKPSGH